MRAETHLYCIRELPLARIEFIYRELGKVIQERYNNPQKDIDIQYVMHKKILAKEGSKND